MDKVKTLISLVRGGYPDWQGFNDPAFKKDEIEYKQSMMKLSNELLNPEKLQQFLDNGDIEHFLENVLNVTQHKGNNLLFNSVPTEGDNALLHKEEMKNMAFCRALFDLIHGAGTGPQRLDFFSKFVSDSGLPDKCNKWTFPTFFLFLTQPETEMFIKPSVIEWLLKYFDADFSLSSNPDGAVYEKIVTLYGEMGNALAKEGFAFSNMVDLQSFVYVAKETAPEANKFLPLFERFKKEYPETAGGKKHISLYINGRKAAKENFELVKQASNNGDDITDLVLDKLLPYTDSESHRKEGKWIHCAPVFSGDVKSKMEGIKWVKPHQWSDVSMLIFNFIENAISDPDNISDLCQNLSKQDLKGFQAGTLSPILSALRPEDFHVVNTKPVQVIGWLSGQKYSPVIADYPLVNDQIKDFVKRYKHILSKPPLSEIRPEDVFDMFSHWMVAIIDYFKTKYWKITPGNNAKFWDLCLENRNMAIGWSDIGDISKIKSKNEFDKICNEVAKANPDEYKKAGMNQVWKFSKIKVGDKIIANRGIKEVIGIGTVIKPYYYVEGEGFSHRIDVEWEEDLGLIKIDKPGWVKTLIEIKREEYEEILKGPTVVYDEGKLISLFQEILQHYPEAVNSQFSGSHPVYQLFSDAQQIFENISFIQQQQNLFVKASCGQGNWARVPWIAFMDRRETETTQKGVYVVILFKSDMKGLYLTLNQGITDPKGKLGSLKGSEFLIEKAKQIRALYPELEGQGFILDNNLVLDDKARLGDAYATSTIAYKYYSQEDLQQEKDFLKNLEILLNSYQGYVSNNETNYWVFQCNPQKFDLNQALKDNNLKTWSVSSHKDKIKKGDKAILWATGKNSGCYALLEVVSDVYKRKDSIEEMQYYVDKSSDEELDRCEIKVVHSFVYNPITKEQIINDPILQDLNVGFQGTNFVAKKEQYDEIARRWGETMDSPIEIAEYVRKYVSTEGFIFEPWQIASYITALRTKPFVILAGVSGTGKSKLPALIGKATGGIVELIPVRPDWTDSSDVLGYCDIQGKFHPGRLLEFAEIAQKNPSNHYVAIIDEMNLARVEYYFAEILSKIEDRQCSENGGYESKPLLSVQLTNGDEIWQKVCFPSNFSIVGTVNMDETTHGFSRKVLDRAFTIELSDIDLSLQLKGEYSKGLSSINCSSSFWHQNALKLADFNVEEENQQIISEVVKVLQQINKFLVKAQLQVGYRVRDEIVLYCLRAQEIRDTFVTRQGEEVKPLDLALNMKILPRIAGGSNSIRHLIGNFLGWAYNGKELKEDEQVEKLVRNWKEQDRPSYFKGAKFPVTTAKLCLMWSRLDDEGFTSYWL